MHNKKEAIEEKEKLKDELTKLMENSKLLIDLTGKILFFFEPPQHDLWNILKPILSHDKPEIEFPYVDKKEGDVFMTRNVSVKGWPAVIFCSAKDESNWPIWPEIQSRFLITSPNMIPQKYYQSNILVAQKKGLPNLIKEQIILSKEDIENTKKCILFLQNTIEQIRKENCKNNNSNNISLWIPYQQYLAEILPSNKGTDVRITNRIFLFLNIVPLIKSHCRSKLVIGGEKAIIATLDDLKEVLSITQNITGIPKYKIEFFNNVFYPCYKAKDKPDSNADGIQEEMVAVTTRQLCDFYKEKTGKPISTDNMKKTYLNELANNGFIEEQDSIINHKQYIYYPIVNYENDNSFQDAMMNKMRNTTYSVSLISNADEFDNSLQYNPLKIAKNLKNIPNNWLISEILTLALYRIDETKVSKVYLADYLNREDDFQLLDSTGKRMTIKDFIESYENDSNLSYYCFKKEFYKFESKIFGSMRLLSPD